jgi:hypothetical protein
VPGFPHSTRRGAPAPTPVRLENALQTRPPSCESRTGPSGAPAQVACRADRCVMGTVHRSSSRNGGCCIRRLLASVPHYRPPGTAGECHASGDNILPDAVVAEADATRDPQTFSRCSLRERLDTAGGAGARQHRRSGHTSPRVPYRSIGNVSPGYSGGNAPYSFPNSGGTQRGSWSLDGKKPGNGGQNGGAGRYCRIAPSPCDLTALLSRA